MRPNMDIYCISRGRSQTLTTPQLFDLDKNQFHIVLNTQEEVEEYKTNADLAKCIFHVSGTSGNVQAHKWKYDNLLKDGEWSICVDDNLRGFQRVRDPLFQQTSAIFKKHKDYIDLTGEEFLEIVRDDLQKADSIGAKMYGTAPLDNPLANAVKYKPIGFIQHKFFAIKKCPEVNYDLNVAIREEYDITAQHLLHFGKILRNDFLWCKRKHFQAGGIGNYEKRAPGYLKDTEYLTKKFPELFRVNNGKIGLHGGTEIAIKRNTPQSLAKWRLEMKLNKLI